ncbi:MAG: ATP-binding protein [Burkholderiaceae bacterium]|nr:ATP-binding protein [Burkholderiaceae bacterium]
MDRRPDPPADRAADRAAESASSPADDVHALALQREFDWLAALIDLRFARYFADPAAPADPPALDLSLPAPPPLPAASGLARLLAAHGAGAEERAALALAAMAALQPQRLDAFFTRNALHERRFSEFGGWLEAGSGFWPTAQTLRFLLAGNDLARGLALLELFEPDHWFARHGLLQLRAPAGEGPALSRWHGALQLGDEAWSRLCSGRSRPPAPSLDFPARPLHTSLDWSDLVLHASTQAQVEEIALWLQHGPALLAEHGMAARQRPGWRALFHGPPGTGKTLTAALLGKRTGREVYQVDLSLVVSKYIGETEKNLARVFDRAQHQGWILFFDEADALFGKRSETRDAHDRYANQEVAYLLQRIEVFDGITVLASNRRENMDAAFARRFESVVYFPLPRADERLRLWRDSLPATLPLDADVDLAELARNHELGGGAIANVARHAALMALAQHGGRISAAALRRGIQRELSKEGRAG